MNNHRVHVSSVLAGFDANSRLLFGLFVADRLRICAHAFFGDNSAWRIYASTIELFFEAAGKASTLDPNAIKRSVAELESIVPESGEPLRAQAQSCVVCLVETLELAAEYSEDGSHAIANCAIDALDNYVFYVQRCLSGRLTSPGDYAILSRELQTQVDDLKLLSKSTSISRSEITERRIENLQFVVPPAVGHASG